MDAINKFVKHVVNTRYESLPGEVVDVTKKQVMDSLAVAIAGSKAQAVGELVEIYREWGGKPESTIWVYGDRLPSIVAAQVNATMVHARDFDDTHDVAVLHTSVVAIPVAFAVAERLGTVDGKALITAIALGIDLCSRLCLACTSDYFAGGWHFTPLHGAFSTAAVAGKLMGLNEVKLLHALGIAYHQAAGNLQCVDDGALTKRCGPGFASRNGILSAVMAEKGLTGAVHVLQGERGLFKQYHRNAYKPEVLTKDLGSIYEGVNVSFKPYPCCRYNHPGIDAVLDLMKEHRLKLDDIDRVEVHVGTTAMSLLADPLDVKRNPRNAVDAQFSLPWAIASTLAHGKFTVGDITEEATKDKDVLSLSNRVSVVVAKELCLPGIEPSIVNIISRSGKTFTKRVNAPYGSPQNPMSMDAMATKLRDAVPYGYKRLTSDNVERLIEVVSNLEKIKNVKDVIKMMV
jgi:2-methylcitrate dehydratase PrpD